MSNKAPPTQHDRDRVIATLSDGFANGALDVDEFERRVAEAQHATSAEALVRVVPAELAASGTTALAPAPPTVVSVDVVPASRVKAKGALLSILGSNRRAGTWTPPRSMRVVAVLGNAELDFREARMPAGPVEINVVGVLGNVEIVVPPELPVEVEGVAVLGNCDHLDRVPVDPDPEAPLLRIRGVAVLGNLEVKMRLRGETEGDAGRRGRRERLEGGKRDRGPRRLGPG